MIGQYQGFGRFNVGRALNLALNPVEQARWLGEQGRGGAAAGMLIHPLGPMSALLPGRTPAQQFLKPNRGGGRPGPGKKPRRGSLPTRKPVHPAAGGKPRAGYQVQAGQATKPRPNIVRTPSSGGQPSDRGGPSTPRYRPGAGQSAPQGYPASEPRWTGKPQVQPAYPGEQEQFYAEPVDNTMTYVAGGAAVVALAALVFAFTRKKK